jgi:HTH-type transcriptional regulator/antitoxin HigA
MAKQTAFNPDYATPPGATLLEWLEDADMTQSELAQRLGRSEKFVSELINGKAPLSRRVALDLESVTGIPAKMWNRLEGNYRDTLDALQRDAQPLGEEQERWLDQIPTTWLRKLKFISATRRQPKRLYDQVLAFFQVASPEAWDRTWNTAHVAAFRKSPTFTTDTAAVATWLQAGRLLAARGRVPEYHPAELQERLPAIRALTRKEDLVSALTEQTTSLLAEAGVVLVFAPTPPKVACSAATQWHAGRPMILMSLRYTSDDHIWFSLFHEIGHVLLDPNTDTLEGDGEHGDEDSEDRANAFASDVLIPHDQAPRLKQIKSLDAAKTFAEEIGVAPGVVVGRLQHDGRWPYKTGNGLKKRVKWNLKDA